MSSFVSFAFLIDRVSSEERNDIIGQKFEQQIEDKNGAADSDSHQMLLPGLTSWMQREELASVLDDQEVDDDDDDPDDQEGRVVKETIAEVLFVMNLPGGNHINDLEPDEKVEDEGHVSARVSTNVSVILTVILLAIFALWESLILVNFLVEFVSVDVVTTAGEDEFAIIQIDHPSVLSIVSEGLI